MWTPRSIIRRKHVFTPCVSCSTTPYYMEGWQRRRRRRCWGRWDSAWGWRHPGGRLESDFCLMPAINTDPLVFLTSDAMCETKSQPSRAEQLWKPALHVSDWWIRWRIRDSCLHYSFCAWKWCSAPHSWSGPPSFRKHCHAHILTDQKICCVCDSCTLIFPFNCVNRQGGLSVYPCLNVY